MDGQMDWSMIVQINWWMDCYKGKHSQMNGWIDEEVNNQIRSYCVFLCNINALFCYDTIYKYQLVIYNNNTGP